MALTVEAIYENGVLRLAEPLPLKEHERVQITIEQKVSWVQATSGIMGWTGDTETLRRIAEDPEYGILQPE